MNEIDFRKYYNVKEVENYDVFIGQNGEYYKVRNIMKRDARSHYIWAEAFLRKEKIYKEAIKKQRDILNYLIDEYGYIRYSSVRGSRNPVIDFPINISKEQQYSLYNLLKAKEEYLTEEQKYKLENSDINKNLSDNYFVKRLGYRGAI